MSPVASLPQLLTTVCISIAQTPLHAPPLKSSQWSDWEDWQHWGQQRTKEKDVAQYCMSGSEYLKIISNKKKCGKDGDCARNKELCATRGIVGKTVVGETKDHEEMG
jgi:hypothetical protein